MTIGNVDSSAAWHCANNNKRMACRPCAVHSSVCFPFWYVSTAYSAAGKHRIQRGKCLLSFVEAGETLLVIS